MDFGLFGISDDLGESSRSTALYYASVLAIVLAFPFHWLCEFSRSTALYYASVLTRYPLAFLFHWLCEFLRFIESTCIYIMHHLTYYYLARPLVMTWLATWLYQSLDMSCHLLISSTCHAISWHQAWYTDSYNYLDNGNVVPDYCYVLITVMYTCYDIAHSLNLIIMLINHKKDNLYGVWEEVMDAGMISRLWLGNMAHGYSYVPL